MVDFWLWAGVRVAAVALLAVGIGMTIAHVDHAYKGHRVSGVCVYYIGKPDCVPIEEWRKARERMR